MTARRRIACAAFVAALVAAAMRPASAQPAPEAGQPSQAPDGQTTVNVTAHPLGPISAPADEYFGRLKLSNLGIKNIIRAFRVEGNSPLALPMQRGRMEAVNSALFQWGDRYPRDPWYMGALFGFADVLEVKGDPATDAMAIDLLLQADERAPGTKYAALASRLVRQIHPTSVIDWTAPPFPAPTLAQTLALPSK